MKKLCFSILVLLAFDMAQAQIKLPIASPLQKTMQEFGAGAVEVTYCRPSRNGRKIFGTLEKYGQVWRTGANATTKIRFTEPVIIANQNVDSGTYALFTIPNEKEWTIIINKGYKAWGAYDYNKEEDVVRFNVKPLKLEQTVELFTIDFVSLKKEAVEMRIAWENTQVVVPITMDIKSVLKQKVESILSNPEIEKKPFMKIAQYYNEVAEDPKTALLYCDKASEASGSVGYRDMYYKVELLDQMGNKIEAKANAEKALLLAKAANDKEYVDAFAEQIATYNKAAAPEPVKANTKKKK